MKLITTTALLLLAAQPALHAAPTVRPDGPEGAGTPFINEIFASHAGTDDREFIELRGAPGGSLDGHVVLVVEGEGAGRGTLDQAWDLSGHVFPADGFYVLGNSGVVGIDFDIGASNRIENGTETFYLVHALDTLAVTSLVGSNLDADGDLVTDLGLVATIVDLVAMVDSGFDGTSAGDQVYDGAWTLGPDGTTFPAGVFRYGSDPGIWCDATWLDVDDVANADQPRTPGGPNTASCAGVGPGQPVCRGDGSGGPCPCGNEGDPGEGCAHSGAVGMTIGASGTASVAQDDLVLTASSCPVGNSGAFFVGTLDPGIGTTVLEGIMCIEGDTRRFGGVFQNSGSATDSRFVQQLGPEAYFTAGSTYFFQYWSRDVAAASPCGTSINFSPAYAVTMLP